MPVQLFTKIMVYQRDHQPRKPYRNFPFRVPHRSLDSKNYMSTLLIRRFQEDVLRLAHEQNLVVLADEVYQTNIFEPEERPFISFKKVLRSLPEDISHSVELISFHSTSKGQIGECGRRGGYFELVNIDPEVEAQMFKMASTQLCAAVPGQIGLDIMVKPPQPGDASYDLYTKEIETIHHSLLSRSQKLHKAFDSLEGFTCSESQGMFCFGARPSTSITKADRT